MNTTTKGILASTSMAVIVFISAKMLLNTGNEPTKLKIQPESGKQSSSDNNPNSGPEKNAPYVELENPITLSTPEEYQLPADLDIKSIPTVLKHLESLALDGVITSEYKKAVWRAFSDKNSSEFQSSFSKAALESKVPLLQDTARALGFADLVSNSGFPVALAQFEEKILANSDTEEVIDFIVDQVAPTDRLGTLEWLRDQPSDLWEESLPLILTDWVVESPDQAQAWIQRLDGGDFRDRAIAEFAPTAVKEGLGQFSELVTEIQDEDIRQEARIRTGEISFTVLGKKTN